MGTERLKPLHNFTLPCDLRWGNQKHLRCMKVNNNTSSSNHRFSSAAADQHHHLRSGRERDSLNGSDKLAAPTGGGGADGIAAVREKVMFDLQTATDKMKDAIFKEGGLEEGEVRPPESERPWNLRTRRAGFKTVVRNSDGGGLRLDMPKNNPLTIKEQSPMLRNGGDGAAAERPKFSLSLSKKEIEDDFAAMGLRLPRRPKKRPRNVQKQLDNLFPGVWLTEVTTDMYKVQEPAP